jgi:hypothetical protein
MINQNIPRFEKAFAISVNVVPTTQTTRAIPSSKDPRTIYYVNLLEKSCTCPDYQFRGVECKHIKACYIKDGVI